MASLSATSTTATADPTPQGLALSGSWTLHKLLRRQRGKGSAVALTPSAAAGDLRLDTEIIRLQHEFGTLPSRVRFTLRANLVDNKTREVLAWKEFDASVAATSEDAYGGVVAANSAVATGLENVLVFCAEAAHSV